MNSSRPCIDLTDERTLEKLKTYKVFAVLWLAPSGAVELPIGKLARERLEEEEKKIAEFVVKRN